MEDVLDVYQRPYDARRPVVCLDEAGKELQGVASGRDSRPAVPQQRGKETVQQDYEYERQGSTALFIACEPLRGYRQVTVTDDRTAITFAHVLQRLLDEDYAQAEKVVLVTDNLNTHHSAALYEAFPPAEAKRLADRVEWHYTPEHGSWLNIAEIEISILHRQCLNRRFADRLTLDQEVAAWVTRQNAAAHPVNWQFTASDARIKLKRLYPIVP